MSIVRFAKEGFRGWWEARRARRLQEQLLVEFDHEHVKVRVLERLPPEWNQAFRWADIKRVCYKDEGMTASDNLLLELRGREHVVVVPVEARGGQAFFDALCDRGLMPEPVRKKAMADTSGGVHCWPPHGK